MCHDIFILARALDVTIVRKCFPFLAAIPDNTWYCLDMQVLHDFFVFVKCYFLITKDREIVKVHAEDQDSVKAPVSYAIYPGW